MSRQRVIYKFCLFFTGWAVLGHILFTKFFFEEDENGERQFIPPDVVSKKVRILREDHFNRILPMASFKPPPVHHPFDT
jgi:hypothetical protein